MKINTVEGTDNIPVEMHKTLGEKAERTSRALQRLYNRGVRSENIIPTVIVRLKNKPNATTCKDNRTFRLLTHASKFSKLYYDSSQRECGSDWKHVTL